MPPRVESGTLIVLSFSRILPRMQGLTVPYGLVLRRAIQPMATNLSHGYLQMHVTFQQIEHPVEVDWGLSPNQLPWSIRHVWVPICCPHQLLEGAPLEAR